MQLAEARDVAHRGPASHPKKARRLSTSRVARNPFGKCGKLAGLERSDFFQPASGTRLPVMPDDGLTDLQLVFDGHCAGFEGVLCGCLAFAVRVYRTTQRDLAV